LTDIHAALPHAPLELVDAANKIWHLRNNLKLEQGATLVLHGSAAAGDVNQLRLQSNNTSDPGAILWVRAQWGTIDIQSTKITSWDDAANGPDTEHATFMRSYIHVRSFLEADGITARESRMNIASSEISHLGFFGAEAYGLSWKVLGSQAGLFDKVDVRGDVTNCNIHHNYFGMYTFGAFEMKVLNNEVHDNVGYGVDPHDDSDSLLIEGNDVHHNGRHGIIASKRCDHVVIRGNKSHDNLLHGIMLHSTSNNGLIENNESFGNGDTGVTIFDSHDCTIRGNIIRDNAKGLRFSVGSSNNLAEGNEIFANKGSGLYFFKGNDAPSSGDGHPKLNRLINNNVHDNLGPGVKATDSDDNLFQGNQFVANNNEFELRRCLRNIFDGNSFPDNLTVSTAGKTGVAASTIFRNQPRVQVQIDAFSSVTFEDPLGSIFDPFETGIGTTVTSTGSSLKLTRTEIGTDSVVLTRNFKVVVTEKKVTVDPTTWNTGLNTSKAWTSVASAAALNVKYIVGDLNPNELYGISKNGTPVSSVLADANGTLTFEDVAGTTSPVLYSLVALYAGGPQSPPVPPPEGKHGGKKRRSGRS
jgi:parallel beta-helix repeat protein